MEMSAPNHRAAISGSWQAAERGHAHAIFRLAVFRRLGYGCEADPEEAFRLFQQAAAQGHSGAQCELGIAYERGRGVERNPEEAVKWYQIASKQGDL